ncbi:cytochrome b5 domain-containing protein [Clostridium sp. E02]|uniref:cytochrome b5 domain-containing protein n=1 Tax=Clostridium sp. E02 TaxID=2487134 RepID=UPI001FAA49F4|nr:cytochrome b5 domain-containing protein [Clostridium sp. E02]
MDLNLFVTYLGNSLKKINSDVEKLHSNQYNNSDVLDHLSSEVIMLQNHLQYFAQFNQQQTINETESYDMNVNQLNGDTETPEEEPSEEEEPPRYFTLTELAQYNGKDGNPAYVAVNGVVYNVSNNRLWSGGSHFWGLTAGKDLTTEFAACHPGAMVLNVLPIVGYMREEPIQEMPMIGYGIDQ